MSQESPLDRFKLALTGAARAIGRDAETEVMWTAEAPGIQGNTIRVPMPPRALPAAQAIEARGFADSFALRQRHHNQALHARHAPVEPDARACYDAVEMVRYEALGSNAYSGMRGNLDAALQVRIAADPITRATDVDDVPVQSALALLLREKLTGQPVPAAASANVDQLRAWIEDKAAGDFERLATSLDDQRAFPSLTLDM